jgi:hypothetical protein
MTRPRTQTIPGFRIQPKLPLGFPYFGGIVEAADFTHYDDLGDCVEVLIRIGLLRNPYTILLSIEQAIEADIVECD